MSGLDLPLQLIRLWADLPRGPSHSAITGGWAGHIVDPNVIHTRVIHLVSQASYYELHIIRHLITH